MFSVHKAITVSQPKTCFTRVCSSPYAASTCFRLKSAKPSIRKNVRGLRIDLSVFALPPSPAAGTHLMPDYINDLAAARRFLGFSLTFLLSKRCAAAPILSSKSRSTSGNAFVVIDTLCHHNTEAGLTGIQISVTNFPVSLVMP